MATRFRKRSGAEPTLSERHPALMTVVVLIVLVVISGSAGLAVGRMLVVGVNLLLGMVDQEF